MTARLKAPLLAYGSSRACSFFGASAALDPMMVLAWRTTLTSHARCASAAFAAPPRACVWKRRLRERALRERERDPSCATRARLDQDDAGAGATAGDGQQDFLLFRVFDSATELHNMVSEYLERLLVALDLHHPPREFIDPRAARDLRVLCKLQEAVAMAVAAEAGEWLSLRRWTWGVAAPARSS